MKHLGDYPTSATVEFKWNTQGADGASITRSTDGTLKIYKGHSVTERSSLAGVTQTEDFDSAVGVHHVQIDLSDNTDAGFYAAGNEYQVVETAMTIDGKVVNAVLAEFSIERAGGVLALLKAAGLANARIDSNVTRWLGTAAATPATAGIPSVAIEAAAGLAQAAADKAWSTAARTLTAATNITSTGGTTFTQTGDAFVRLGAPAGTSVSVDVAAVKTDTAAVKVKTDQLAFTNAGKVDAAILAAGDFVQAAADKVWASTTRTLSAFSTALAVSVWDVLASAVATASSIGKQIKDNLDVVVSTRAPEAGGNVAAIKTKTDSLTFTTANKVDASILAAGDFAQGAADKVWATAARTLTSFGTLAADVWASATRLLTAGTNIVLAKGVGVTGFNDLSAAQVNTEADTALADYDGPTSAELVSEINDVQADVAAVKVDTAAILVDTGTTLDGRLPAALVGGRMDASVGAMAANVMTAAAADPDLTTELQAGLATAAALATVHGFIDTEVASILAAVDTEVAAIKAKTDNLPASPAAVSDIPTVGAIADQVWDEVLAGHLTAGTTGAGLNAAGSAGDPWATALPGAYGAGSAGKILGDNLNATVGSRATQASVDVIDDFVDTEVAAILTAVDTEVAAIKAKTDNLPASPAATGDIPTAGAVADAVWDEALAGHVAAGSAGEQLAAAGSAGDPWVTALPGAYSAGQAGKILGDNLNATVSSRASQSSLDTVDDFLDTEIAAIKAKTDALPTDPADESLLEAAITAAAGPSASAIADEVETRTIAAVTSVVNKVTPIDVDGLTFAAAMELLMAVTGGVTDPVGSTVAFKKRDGTTTKLTITYGVADGERTASVAA